MSHNLHAALIESRQDDVARAARQPRQERSQSPPRTRTRVRGAAAAALVRTALRLDSERAWRTLV